VGVLALLDLLKKKEQITVVGIQSKKKKKKIQKYTVLKSPFVTNKAREQFKLQLHTAVILFSVKPEHPFCFQESFVESLLLKYTNSQYLEVRLSKRYKAA
jgi:hypothetical protein